MVINQAAFNDTTPPAVTIANPSTGNVTTDLDTITMAGTATDNIGVVRMALSIDGSPVDSRVARVNGTAQWTTTAIPLHPGANRLTVTAFDASGNAAVASVIVNSRPENLLIPVAQSSEGANFLAFDSAGALYFSTFNALRRLKPDGSSELVAGGSLGFGGDGGAATAAKLNYPQGLAIDRNGNIFIADRANHRIRKITPNGTISTIAGSGDSGGFGGDGGPGASAGLNVPQSVALDAAGNLYIADQFNHRVRKLSSDGRITTVAGNGSAGESGDGGDATAAQLALPYDLAFDEGGNLYISTSSRVRKVTPQGVISTYAGGGAEYGGEGAPAVSVALNNPTGLAFDRAGVLYIADRNNRTIRAVSPGGTIRTIVRGTGPTDLAGDLQGTIFVAESQRITKISRFPASDPQPPVIAITAPTTASAYATAAQYFQVRGTASDNTLVVRIGFSNDRNPSGSIIHNLISENAAYAEGEIGAMQSSADERSTISWQVNPQLKPGINRLTFTAWDVLGNSGSTQLTVNYKPFGLLETLAGRPGALGFNDSAAPRDAQFNAPRNLAFDSAGNLFVADTGNHRIRKITQAGAVSTVAGSGSVGYSGDGGAATVAELNGPRGLAIDSAGNLYFADSFNHRIRKVNSAGIISTVAGTGEDGFSGDEGPATMARLNMPLGVLVDAEGNLLIADTDNRRIRKVAVGTGVITTVAAPSYSSSQAFPAPGLNYPASIALDREGQRLIADRDSSRVYKLSETGSL